MPTSSLCSDTFFHPFTSGMPAPASHSGPSMLHQSSHKCTSLEEFPLLPLFPHNYWFFSTDAFQIHVLISSEHSSLILNPQKHPTVQLLEILTRLQICSTNPSLHLQAHHVNLPCSSNPSKPIQKAAPPFSFLLCPLSQITDFTVILIL